MKLEIDIPYFVFEQVKRENTIKNVLNKIDFAVRNGVERPHGEWLPGREIGQMWTGDKFVAIDYEDFSCSCCGVVVEESTEPEWNFCPNCGADMRKEGEAE